MPRQTARLARSAQGPKPNEPPELRPARQLPKTPESGLVPTRRAPAPAAALALPRRESSSCPSRLLARSTGRRGRRAPGRLCPPQRSAAHRPRPGVGHTRPYPRPIQTDQMQSCLYDSCTRTASLSEINAVIVDDFSVSRPKKSTLATASPRLLVDIWKGASTTVLYFCTCTITARGTLEPSSPSLGECTTIFFFGRV